MVTESGALCPAAQWWLSSLLLGPPAVLRWSVPESGWPPRRHCSPPGASLGLPRRRAWRQPLAVATRSGHSRHRGAAASFPRGRSCGDEARRGWLPLRAGSFLREGCSQPRGCRPQRGSPWWCPESTWPLGAAATGSGVRIDLPARFAGLVSLYP